MSSKKVHTNARIKTVGLSELRVSPAAQREFNHNWGSELAETFDIDKVGTFVCSYRDGIYWIIDGQHRHYALTSFAKAEFGEEWGDWTIQVWVHEGLDERKEAELFLSFNNRKAINNYDKFKVGVTAELPVPSDINRVVLALDLRVAKDRRIGSVSAVGTLEKIYNAGGAVLLRKTLQTVRDAWDSSDFDANALAGVSLFISRYEGRYKEDRLVKQIASLHNGAKSLKQRAYVLKEQYGGTHATSHAAAITELYNKGLRGVSSLGSWWKSTSEPVA
ncbi:hypothetical protein G7068_11845 [Leucobacter viscericola]|uniref:ParB-like nuclease domain-containing protein n=1 Tax=Leucobacter viscericola TaxID=2714935 RepID=A0A6G7XHG1_9MICO|nr:DUF6551 family protein [Leucobacter viscericola]QIK63801.1 hypothetical protein G7068_11845 [Leucobacter viscericola]